jgi:hypothetical protein
VAKMTVTPDLSLTKGADPPANAPVTQGDTLTYTLVELPIAALKQRTSSSPTISLPGPATYRAA